jgi:competence protein ComEC
MDSVQPSPDAYNVWRAPLVPAALAVTAGIIADRRLGVPLSASFLLLVASLIAWAMARTSQRTGLPLVYLALAGVAVGAAYHHYRRDVFPADDIGNLAPKEPRPVQLRGVLDEEPYVKPPRDRDPLRAMESKEFTTTVLQASYCRERDEWVTVSGRVAVVSQGKLLDLHVGDEVEVVGRMARIEEPGNPGEFDSAGFWRDQGVRTQIVVRKTAAAVTRLSPGSLTSITGWLAAIRGWGQSVLSDYVDKDSGDHRLSGLASALILGEGAPLNHEDWEPYKRTGVIHVIVISGQHLVLLAWILWSVLRRLQVRQRHGAWVVGGFLLTYALLSGWRPPAIRSAVTVCAVCGGLILRRRTMPANLLALAWLAVAAINPMDLFSPGCQLSFLSVIVLIWVNHFWLHREEDPIEALIAESRPAWQRWGLEVWWMVVESYLLSLIIWLALTPLVAYHYHVVPAVAILLGPPLTLLTSIALVAGFLLLVCGLDVVRTLLGYAVDWPLLGCQELVRLGNRPGVGFTFVGNIPEWWLWLFYLGLLAVLTQRGLRPHWRFGVLAGLGWVCVGLLFTLIRLPSAEMRCTFLAVGHGGCTVIETPDGRVLLYDTGAITGPQVTERQIVPFLWHRGIRHIDEVLLSHGDLDHFNGLPALLERFAVGRVTCTPTFENKDTRGVDFTLATLRRYGVPIRIVKKGDVIQAGDVILTVLHPPAQGPDGSENERSLVLRVYHEGHTLLLSGDLEGRGLAMVTAQNQREPIDVLMAPHHGSTRVDGDRLVHWCDPQAVISSQGVPRGANWPLSVYSANGREFLPTWTDGAVTVRSHSSGLIVETFKTGKRISLRTRPGRT